MYNEFNIEVASAGPGHPVVITGLSGTPNVADQLMATKDERKVKDIASLRESKQKEIEMQSKQKNFSIESFGDDSNNKKINIIIEILIAIFLTFSLFMKDGNYCVFHKRSLEFSNKLDTFFQQL